MSASNPSFGHQLAQFIKVLVLPPAALIALREGWVISEEAAQMLWLAYAGFLAMVFAAWRFERKRHAAQRAAHPSAAAPEQAFDQPASAAKAS